jgi:O-antigen/teichoic acid export membrane protein
VLRLVGYVLGSLASVAASAIVFRQLGVVDAGRFVTVMTLVLIALSISDLGLTTIGIREYSVRSAEARHRFLRNLLGIRVTFAVGGLAAAVLFAAAVDYTSVMIVGTAIAGFGVLLYVVQQSLTIPLQVRLQFGWVAALQLVFQIGVVLNAALLAGAGAGLLPFFTIQIPILIPVIVWTVALGGRASRSVPVAEPQEWRRILRQILPYSAAVVLSALYFRIAQIMVSLLSTGEEAGYFGVAFRVSDGLTTIAPLLVTTALPLLARAARDDTERFTRAARQVAEVMVITGTGLSLTLFLGAEFAIDLIGGSDFGASVTVLRVLALALVGTFVVAGRGYALLSLGRMRAILISNAVALGVACVVGVPLAQAYGAIGAATTLVVTEFVLAGSYNFALTRGQPEFRLPLTLLVRVAGAAVVGASVLALNLPSFATATLGAMIYGAAVLALGVLPVELRRALLRRGPVV